MAGQHTAGRPADQQPPLLDGFALTVQTYKRDSVWNTDARPFKPVRTLGHFRPKEKEITVNGTAYRYEEGRVADVVRLLERPRGTEDIHRIYPPLAGAEQTARALILLLREQERADAAKK